MRAPAAGSVVRQRPTTLRGRVALELLAATVAFTMIAGAVIALIWTARMRAGLDEGLETIAIQADPGEADVAGRVGAALPEFVGKPVVIVSRGADGAVIASRPALTAPPPFDPARASGIVTIKPGPLSPALGAGMVRLLTRPAGGDRFVQVAMSRSDLAERENDVWVLLTVIVPLLAGVAAVGAWAVAGRRLARLGPIAGLVSVLNPSNLHRRLEPTVESDELGRLSQEFNRMLGRLEAGFGAQDRFISEVSHELKTPVSVLLLEAQVLERSEPDALVYAKFVASVEDEMRRLSQLVESFLTLARAKHGDTQVRRVPVDVNDAAMEAGQHCWLYARMRSVRLSVVLVSEEHCPEPPLVAGDPDLLRTMVENLLRNAIAVAPRDSTVDLGVACDDGHVTIRVRDRGPGVPEAVASRIFDRFVTLDHTRKGTRGSGLGLTIARGIAELHGGDVMFRNVSAAEGGGAEFSVRLPVQTARNGAVGSAVAVTAAPA